MNIFSKKGQGLSMNVIIIAAIALLVLVILSVLVMRAGNQTGDAYTCESSPGTYCANDCADGDNEDPFKTCEGEEICCRTI